MYRINFIIERIYDYLIIRLFNWLSINSNNNTIEEVFTCNLFTGDFLSDQNTHAYHLIKDKINLCCLHNDGFILIDIQYKKNCIIYVYNYTGVAPKKAPCEMFMTKINMWRGAKTCQYCDFLKPISNKEICLLFGKPKGKCLYWDEHHTNFDIVWSKI